MQRGLNTFLLWFLPGRLVNDREVIVALALLMVGAALAVALRRSKADAPEARIAPSGTIGSWGLQILCYLCVLVVSKSYFDPVTPLNDRILSPLLPTLLVLLLAFLGAVWQRAKLRPLVVAALLVFFAFYAYRAVDLVPRLYQTGIRLLTQGLAQLTDAGSLCAPLPQTPIFSNSPAAIYMWTERPGLFDCRSKPDAPANAAERRGIGDFQFGFLEPLRHHFRGIDAWGLTEVDKFKDGSIYRLAPLRNYEKRNGIVRS